MTCDLGLVALFKASCLMLLDIYFVQIFTAFKKNIVLCTACQNLMRPAAAAGKHKQRENRKGTKSKKKQSNSRNNNNRIKRSNKFSDSGSSSKSSSSSNGISYSCDKDDDNDNDETKKITTTTTIIERGPANQLATAFLSFLPVTDQSVVLR